MATFYLAVLTTEDHVAAFPTDRFGNQEATTFIEATDFSQTAVVVLHDRQSSSHPNLQLVGTGREGKLLTVETEYPGEGATADITTDTLLVRVPTGEVSVPGGRATIHPQFGNPVRIGTASLYDNLPEFDTPADLGVQNRDCESATPSVTVTHRGDHFYRGGLELELATRHTVEGLSTHFGEWTVSVRANGETTTRTWDLTDDPGDVLVTVAGDGTISLARQADAGDGPTDACHTDGFTSESTDPAANVDPPVDLWLLDRGQQSTELTVTVSDGDTRVFSRSYETSSGVDKIHRLDLLAKQTDYTVTVSAEDGREVTKTVTVDEGTRQLTVRVTETGDLTVSLA